MMDLAFLNTHSTVELPFEITELIIDAAANQGDRETLRNFACVSSYFVVRCQKHLFHTIDLGDRCISGEEYYHRFFCILSQRPNFRAYVEDLRLVDTYIWDRDKDWTWLVEEDSICDMLDLLPNLRSFSLTFNTGQPTWPSFKPCLRHALMQLAKRPSIRSYALSHIHDFPPPLLVTLATIKRLKLNDVSVHTKTLTYSLGVVLELASLSTPCLESLVLKAPTAATLHVLHNLLLLYPHPTLKRLRVSLMDEKDADMIVELWGLLQWAGEILTHLEWRPATRPQIPALRPPAPIDLSVLPRLESLHFLINFHSEDQPVFQELLALLEQVSSGSHFRELVIECMFLRAVELVACGSDWSALDTVLSKPEFDGLKTVVFGAKLRTVPALKTSAKTILMEQLPTARSRGVKITFDLDLR